MNLKCQGIFFPSEKLSGDVSVSSNLYIRSRTQFYPYVIAILVLNCEESESPICRDLRPFIGGRSIYNKKKN
jgi:hypothetical protein